MHIFSIINIFFDEIARELNSGAEINIPNFGIFKIKTLKSKRIRSVYSDKLKMVKKTKVLRFKLDKKLNKYLVKKSFEDMKNMVKICEEKQE